LPANVAEILERACDSAAGGVTYHRADGTEVVTSYRDLRDAAGRAEGDAQLVLSDPEAFLPRVWGCFLRGVVPVIAPRPIASLQIPECGGDTALLILTSGTTGEPKLVPLTHRNVVACVAASAYVNGYGDDDVSLNWLPLCHIGGLMRSIRDVYLACRQVQVATEVVRQDPLRWLDLIDAHRATFTWGPNAAFAGVVAQRHELPSRRRWSLGCLRSVYSAGEAAVPRTMRAFAEMLAPNGFRADSLRVGWGMTEACLATWSTSFEDVGTPVPGVSLRIVDEHDQIVGEGEAGHLLVSTGGDWIRTGDLGRIAGGRLSITGRAKDVVKLGGISYANLEIEEAVGGDAVACGVETPDGEALAIFAGVDEARVPEVRARVACALGITARFVIPVRSDELPRTALGKIQRGRLRDAFAAGAYERFRRWPFDLRAVPPPAGGAITAAERERAARIAEIVGDVLRVPVDLDDDFFALGGTSLRVAQASTRIGCALVDLFCAPTPLSLARRLMRGAAPIVARRRERPASDAVAIIGMACRFPGAPNVDAFWRLLCEGRDPLTQFSAEELVAAGIDRRVVDDPAYVRAGMVLDDIETFDAEFFGLAARDAEIMDPQQRLLLECAWHAFEDAGHPPAGCERVGIYVGGRVSEYMQFHQPPLDLFGHRESPADGFRRLVVNDKDYLATRLAFALDCRGPAISVQTACSTSLVAVHMACQSLRSGESDFALAGGASIRVPQKAGYLYTDGMIFSPDGRTRPFDAAASGTLFGSGAGVVVLRRLADAIADGDRIYAVVRGSAVNNDGAGPKPAFTAPSHSGQAAVIAEALAAADVDPTSVSYVEAHGTGTAVGDPIEIAALDEVFKRAGARTGSCAVGSVKSNVGHLVQAAGVASLMKTALMLRHRTLVPSANFSKPNPLIDFASSPFFVNTEARAWENGGAPLRAGVSAFGFGGTNAHVVVEEAPAGADAAAESDHPRILPLSAKSPAALRELVAAYANAGGSLRDICASAQHGRAHLPYRAAVVASSIEELREKLAAQSIDDGPPPARPRVAFVFSGQGTQYAGMGRRLYDAHPTFRRAIDDLAMRDALFDRELERTEFAQPALVALQAALVAVWREWGIEPDVVLGHSLGEITAAWTAGVITLDDAMRFAEARGRLMQRAAPGAMAAIFAPPDALASRGYDVAVAALNGPHQTVISGAPDAIEDVLADLRKRGIAARRLAGNSAFHSPLMDPVLDELQDAAACMTISAAQRPIISTLTGAAAEGDFARPAYWRRQAREAVQYSRAVAAAKADVVVQIGPGQDDLAPMLSTLAELYARGIDVDWRRVELEAWRRVALPSYPFQRKRFWLAERHYQERSHHYHPLLGRRIPSPLREVQFQSELTADVAPFARDHWVYGVRPLVMVGQLEMMRAAVGGASSVAIENVVVEQPLLLSDEMRRVQTLVDSESGVRIFSSADGESWDLHSSARARAVPAAVRRVDIAAIRARCRDELSHDAVYARKEAKGAAIGAGIKLVNRVWRGDAEVIAEVALDDEAASFATGYGAYPGVLDSFAQCGELTLADGDPSHAQVLFLPTVLERAVFHDRLPSRVWTTLRRRGDASGDVYGVDGEIVDDEGRVLVSFEGLYFKRATPASLTRAETSYEIEWVPLERADRAVEDGRRVIAAADESAEELCGRALDAAQAMLAGNEDGPLWLITRGGQATGHETAPLVPMHAALWGFGRAVQREQPSLRCRLIDLDPARGDDDELRRAMAQAADEVVVRGGALYARRLRPVRVAPRMEGPYALRAGSERTLEGLAIVPAARREPGPGEVEIEVYATGVNFRDVLTATGRIDGPLGYECSGAIARCGAGASRFQPGDAVMAVAMHTFASHVVVDERLVVAKPGNLTFAAAATSVVAYLTAMHALLERARLRAGERVLVHTAAGGVGHAAVHVARLAGAEVVATASRPKWPAVRALGVEQVMDSRAPGFSRQTETVDVVLNTLGAELGADNLAVLRPGGRIIDLGHPQVLDLEKAAAQAEAAGVEFINFHIAQDVGVADPDHMQELLATLAGHLASGRLPALPYRAFVLSELRHAFETMLRGAHVGKLAIRHPAAERAEVSIRSDATYLVTGGTGAVGTRIAAWLVDRGARHLVLLSRNAVPRQGIGSAEIRTLQADVADESVLRAALASIAGMPPLRGIVHAAGVIDDGVLPHQTRARFAAVLAPKVAGAWNLHRLTASMPLDFFVLVSSVAGLWGNAGQTNYAAANAFLDQLAHFRRQRGLPATSIDYGAWRGAGMAAAIPDAVRQRRAESGAGELDPEQAIRGLEAALAKDRAQVAVFAGASPLLAPAAQERRAESAAPEKGVAPRTLDDALERTRRVVAALCGGGNVDVARPLPELGLDSLTVLLLRGRLIAEFGNAAALPVIRFLEGHSVAELAAMTFERAMAAAAPPPAPAKRWTSLTAIKAAGSRPPIFLVPPAARTAMTFNQFAQSVDGGHPVYGLNPLGLDGQTEPHVSVDEMASHYIDEIRSLQPDGPYLLGGMCFGGHVAWEMARRLTESGCQVPLLILFDASPPLVQRFERSLRDVSTHVMRYYARRVHHHLQQKSLVGALARRLRASLRGAAPLEGDGWAPDAEVSATLRRVIDAHAAASLHYRARSFAGDVLLLESEEFHDYLFHDRWRQLLKGRLETVRFAGMTHIEILQERHAPALAQAVTARLATLK
jgi:acyl transferase domain-containing protein/NADPH:quinone reductase-like Zn-dependent oxidoreductase/thioesterase domain-containing protein